MKEYNARGTRKPAGASHSTPQLLRDHFRIYFPTEATVVNTRGGRGVSDASAPFTPSRIKSRTQVQDASPD